MLRCFDEICSDSFCEKCDVNGYEVWVGVIIVVGLKVVGEISGGWCIEDIEDSRFDDLLGLIVDGFLVWFFLCLIMVFVGFGISFLVIDIDNVSGLIIYFGDVWLVYVFSDWLVGEMGFGYVY